MYPHKSLKHLLFTPDSSKSGFILSYSSKKSKRTFIVLFCPGYAGGKDLFICDTKKSARRKQNLPSS